MDRYDATTGRGYNQNILTVNDFPSRETAICLLERDVSWLRPMYHKFEAQYDGIPLLLWSRSHYWIAPTACIAYLAFIYYGPRYMASRKPFNLSTPLKYWNLLLAVYSIIGASRVVPHTIVFLAKFGWRASLCSPPVYTYGRGAVGLWTGLFIYSKYAELLDTVFIVLRKRKLSFLHWYHHVTVLIYCWDAFVTEQPPGLFYCAMNYFVHGVMYSYYYLSSSMKRVPRWGVIVTVLQILQMFGGIAVTAVSLYNSYKYPFMFYSTSKIAQNPAKDQSCFVSRTNMVSAAVMYTTYFYLFAEFFYERYLKKSPRAKAE